MVVGSATIPDGQMRAAVHDRNGGPEVLHLALVPIPEAGPGDLLVRTRAISVEGGDLLHRRKTPLPCAPHIGGYMSAGEVVAIGASVAGFAVGDRVTCFNVHGSHAEYRAVPADLTWRVPDGLDLVMASTIPAAFGTADDALFAFGQLRPGETVLVIGGSGGVGIAAVQLAAQAGATVFATIRDAEGIADLLSLGATAGIAYRQADIVAETLRLTGGRGVDLIVDMVGIDVAAALGALAYRGRLILVGVAADRPQQLDLATWGWRNQSISKIIFGREMATPRAAAIIGRHLASVASGALTMPIDRIFDLGEAAAAHEHAETARRFGRVVIRA